jgi:hypothetical protein
MAHSIFLVLRVELDSEDPHAASTRPAATMRTATIDQRRGWNGAQGCRELVVVMS